MSSSATTTTSSRRTTTRSRRGTTPATRRIARRSTPTGSPWSTGRRPETRQIRTGLHRSRTAQRRSAIATSSAAHTRTRRRSGSVNRDEGRLRAPFVVRGSLVSADRARDSLPPELRVLAALEESGLKNLQFGDVDLIGYFECAPPSWTAALRRVGTNPQLQLDWFVDRALIARDRRLAAPARH